MRNSILTFTVILLMAIMGCESNMLEPLADDSSKEANLEEAKMDLDDGNYDSAISALSSYKRFIRSRGCGDTVIRLYGKGRPGSDLYA